jgi:hypothetical protein
MNIGDYSGPAVDATADALTFALWPLFGFAFVIYVAVSLALLYHWRSYGMQTKRVILAESVYFIVSGSVLVVALISLILI